MKTLFIAADTSSRRAHGDPSVEDRPSSTVSDFPGRARVIRMGAQPGGASSSAAAASTPANSRASAALR